MGSYDSWIKSGQFDPKRGAAPDLRDFEAERRQKAADILAMGGLSPEQILEANRLQFAQNRPAVQPGQSGYDPRSVISAADGFGQSSPVITGVNTAARNAGEQVPADFSRKGGLGDVYKNFVSSMKASQQSAAQFNYSSDIQKMNLDSLTKLLQEYEKTPPMDEAGVQQMAAVRKRYNELLNVKPDKVQPPAPGPQMPADPGAGRGFFSNVFHPFTTDQTWWGQQAGNAPAASAGFKPSSLNKDAINKIRIKNGLAPIK